MYEWKQLRDINGELCLVQDGKLLIVIIVFGFCLFEDCVFSFFFWVINIIQGFLVIEISIMMVGCWAGIEKVFFFYDGVNFNCVYQVEYIIDYEIVSEFFIVNQGFFVQVCQYSYEGKDYVLVWKCCLLES